MIQNSVSSFRYLKYVNRSAEYTTTYLKVNIALVCGKIRSFAIRITKAANVR
jgi:hypothetical protein